MFELPLDHDPTEPVLHVVGDLDDTTAEAELRWHSKYGRRKGMASSRARRHWASLRHTYPIRDMAARMLKLTTHDGQVLLNGEAVAYLWSIAS